MSALNVKIDNRDGGSWATPSKLTAYVIYGLELALSYTYNTYLCIPKSIKLLVNHVKSAGVCQFVHIFSHSLQQIGIKALGFLNSCEKDVYFERKN